MSPNSVYSMTLVVVEHVAAVFHLDRTNASAELAA